MQAAAAAHKAGQQRTAADAQETTRRQKLLYANISDQSTRKKLLLERLCALMDARRVQTVPRVSPLLILVALKFCSNTHF